MDIEPVILERPCPVQGYACLECIMLLTADLEERAEILKDAERVIMQREAS
jgi:hypothetical protein